MIKFFCDGCGEQVDPASKEIVCLTMVFYKRPMTEQKILCNTGCVAYWADKLD